MKIKLNEKEHDVKVTARSVAMLEKETGKLITDIFSATGSIPPMSVVASMIKSATTLTEEECYQSIDEVPGLFTEIIKEYTAWISRAFAISEVGNSESLMTTN